MYNKIKYFQFPDQLYQFSSRLFYWVLHTCVIESKSRDEETSSTKSVNDISFISNFPFCRIARKGLLKMKKNIISIGIVVEIDS